MKSCEFKIEGMHCAACEILIQDKTLEINGVKNVRANLRSQKIEIEFEGEVPKNLAQLLNSKLITHGYNIAGAKPNPMQIKETIFAMTIALAIYGIFGLFHLLGLEESFNPESINYSAIFVIGVLASLSSCAAVVGSLVLSIATGRNPLKPLAAFHAARLVAFFVLGGLIGLLGTTFKINHSINLALSFLVFFALLINGIVLTGIFPSLSKFSINLPTSFARFSTSAPILLGALTFFLPCGFTQSMQIYALSTGSFWQGAATMLVFALGTFPALALVSFASVKLGNVPHSKLFYKVSGFVLILFAVTNFWGTLVANGLVQKLF
jgi:sulfite exporter TauE/SafE/copper chaperone CopZ